MGRIAPRHDPDRLFVRNGWRHFRRRYSLAEVRWGVVVLIALVLVTVWVAYKGRHPDPSLLDDGASLLARDQTATANRGALPEGLAGEGWREVKVAQFDADNLYIKINGRADYFKSFGFERLYWASLESAGTSDKATIDVEMYDLGSAANALGAYAGERPPDVTPQVSPTGMGHLARNALLITRGRYFVRAIGSDETPVVQTQLEHLRRALTDKLSGEPLPWGYGLFVGRMGLDPAAVSYSAENAFSFGFARQVYAARAGDDSTQIFVMAGANDADTRRLAERFTRGLLDHGHAVGKADGVSWVEERYVEMIAGVTAVQGWVIGVRRAPDITRARAALASLKQAVTALPPELRDRARAARAGAADSPKGPPRIDDAQDSLDAEPVYE